MTPVLDSDSEKQRSTEEIADLMARWLHPATPAREAERARNRLIEAHAEPLIRTIVTRKLKADPRCARGHHSAQQETATDPYGEAVIAICQCLDRWRARPGESSPRCEAPAPDSAPVDGKDPGHGDVPTPDRLLDYVAVVAYNACKDAYTSSPGTQVSYLLTHKKGLALWQNAEHLLLGGYVAWREADRPPASPGILEELHRDPEGFAEAGLKRRHPKKTLRKSSALDRLIALLDRAGGPVEMNALTAAFAILTQGDAAPIQEVSLAPVGDEGEVGRTMVQENLQADTNVEADIVGKEGLRGETRKLLQDLWPRIARLPAEQRAAFLLALPAEIFYRLRIEKIASLTEIALALGVSSETLAPLWSRLPLDDAEIADRLEVTQEQVRNRRQSAYRTLAWHLRPFDRGALRRLWEVGTTLVPMRPAVFMLRACDPLGTSLLALLPRESIASRPEISARLALPEKQIDRIWPELPLRLDRIAQLLHKTSQEVALLYIEARTQLKAQLARIERTVEEPHAVVYTHKTEE